MKNNKNKRYMDKKVGYIFSTKRKCQDCEKKIYEGNKCLNCIAPF